MNLTVMQDGSERLRYTAPELPLYVCRGDLYVFSNMAALCHWHDDVELLLCTEGYLEYNVNGEQLHVDEGNAIFVNSRQMHYGFSADGSNCNYCCYAFRPQQLLSSDKIISQFVLPLLTAYHIPYVILERSNNDHSILLDILIQIDELYHNKPYGYELLALSKVLEFWHKLFNLLKDKLEDNITADTNLLAVKQMLGFIRSNYNEKITLDLIASAGGVCITRCCQYFKKYLGLTPNAYLNSFRLEQAMQMLIGTNQSVTEIADSCGYNSSSYFTEIFTREKGCTPTQYRKKLL